VVEVLQVEADTKESEVVMSRRKREVEMSWLDIVGVWIVWEVILSEGREVWMKGAERV
jgi:hypothetical protein